MMMMSGCNNAATLVTCSFFMKNMTRSTTSLETTHSFFSLYRDSFWFPTILPFSVSFPLQIVCIGLLHTSHLLSKGWWNRFFYTIFLFHTLLCWLFMIVLLHPLDLLVLVLRLYMVLFPCHYFIRYNWWLGPIVITKLIYLVLQDSNSTFSIAHCDYCCHLGLATI